MSCVNIRGERIILENRKEGKKEENMKKIVMLGRVLIF